MLESGACACFCCCCACACCGCRGVAAAERQNAAAFGANFLFFFNSERYFPSCGQRPFCPALCALRFRQQIAMSLAPAPAARPRPGPAPKPLPVSGVGGSQPSAAAFPGSSAADFVAPPTHSPSGGVAHVFDSSDADFVSAAPPKPTPQPPASCHDFSADPDDFVAPPPAPLSPEELARIRAASEAEASEAQRRLESKWAAQLRDLESKMAAQPPTPFSSADLVCSFIHGAEACVQLRVPLCPMAHTIQSLPPCPPQLLSPTAQRAPAKTELAQEQPRAGVGNAGGADCCKPGCQRIP